MTIEPSVAPGRPAGKDEPRDRNGLTEQEFLAQYRPKDYPHPSLTADICVFRMAPGGRWGGVAAPDAARAAEGLVELAGPARLELLLVRRGGHPFLGCWATPGGFVNQRETADAAAARELAEETGVEGLALEPVGLFSTPGRDPRGWTCSQAFVALDDTGAIARAGDDAAETRWFAVEPAASDGRVTLALSAGDATPATSFCVGRAPVTGHPVPLDVRGSGLAFDHAQIVAAAWLTLVGARS